jgi:lantibiotic leader peptide-processing serine protease
MNRGLTLSLAATVLAIGACSDKDSSPTNPSETSAVAFSQTSLSYVISFSAKDAGDVKAAIERAGGKARNLSRPAGLGTAESADPAFAAKLRTERGIRAVAMDTVVQWVPKERVVEASIGDNETFFNAQWAPQSIHAEEAWDAGARGTGARVAVLDGGLNNNHIDLNNSVDVAHSKSFVDGFQFNQDVPCTPTPPATTCVTFSHATHVAGIIAAEDDDLGAIGVAPGATIIGVKVLHGGSGSFGAVIDGIVYAATPTDAPEDPGAGAHIINMSLGAQFPSGRDSKVLALKALLDEATTFAHNEGVLVVASAGNGDRQGRGIDHDLGQWFTLPAQADFVVGVSALGPVGFALNPPIPTSDDFDRLASYSNFGVRIVDFSGPGGDFVLPGNAVCSIPRIPTGLLINFCWVFDMVISPGSLGPVNNSYFFAAGTSMSAPAVSGVAALVVATKHPADADALFNILVNTADDLGAPGVDPVHGNGRVNAFAATQ